jgi:small subunit ribosomal protein S8
MDTIGEFLTKIRNAYRASHPVVEVQSSKMREAIARVLKEQGYIEDYQVRVEGPKQYLRLLLRYGPRGQAALKQITLYSKPGRRLYSSAANLPEVANGLGITIVSTSQGVMTDKEARRRGIGGEIICLVQ